MTDDNEPAAAPGPQPEPGDSSRGIEPTRLSEVIQGAVGKHNIGDLVTTVKRLMLVEALRRSSGNIAMASELLGISRQGVQQMIQRTELRGWVRSLRRDEGERAGGSGA